MTTETRLQPSAVDTDYFNLLDHAHHWILEEPNGPTSDAVCKLCGAMHRFRNWIEEIEFITTDFERPAA